MKILMMLALSSSIVASFAQAAVPKVSPGLYRVDGRPVPVSCLASLAAMEGNTRKAPIDLRTCGNPNPKPTTQADGSVGYDTPDGGYFYYHYLGQSRGVDILLLQSSGGGSGQFTELVGVKSGGHFVRWVRDYAGGDRCNGGITNEKVLNGRLRFDQAITPYDLIKLAQAEGRLEAYKDLEASAASCIGVSHMIDGDVGWTGVTLTEKDWRDREGWTERYRYQACFNKLYREAVLRGHSALDRGAVVAFGQAFTRRCVHRS